MIRLVRVELDRLRWRRAVVLLLLGCFVAPALIWAGTAWSTRPLSDADLARAEQQAAADAEQPWVKQEIRRCERNPERSLGPGTTAEECVGQVTPRAEHYLYRPELSVESMRQSDGVGVVAIVAALLLIAGTTFAGHDWHTGSMSNQLLFEPRRARVWAAKAGALVLLGAVVSAAVLTIFWGATAALAAQRGITTSGPTWELVRNAGLRGVGFAALAGLLGYALTMLFRSTVATLASCFAASAGGTLLLLGVLGEERGKRWLPDVNFEAAVLGGKDYQVWSPSCEAAMMEPPAAPVIDPCMQFVSLGQGVTYWTVILAAVVGLSVLAFQRRDLP